MASSSSSSPRASIRRLVRLSRKDVEPPIIMEPSDLWATQTSKIPTRDFEGLLWGQAGVPDDEEPEPGDDEAMEKNGGVAVVEEEEEEVVNGDDIKDENTKDNDCKDKDAIDTDSQSNDNEEPETIRLTNLCWKRRSGMGKFSVIHPWERRRLVLIGTKVLYFSTKEDEEEDDEVEESTDVVTNTEQVTSSIPSWLVEAASCASLEEDASFRGLFDLSQDGCSVEALEGNFASPTTHEVELKVKGGEKWKVCFDSPQVQLNWLTMLTEAIQSTFGENKEHNFEPGDHVIRWEMLPIVYPIQIHGIVLEAGRNCVIIADFGLTSYGNGAGAGAGAGGSDSKDDQNHDRVMAAWNKVKPKHAKQKQRLNVIALTEPKEIRKWSKIRYGRNVLQTGGHKFTSWFHHKSTSNLTQDNVDKENDFENELKEAQEYIEKYSSNENGVNNSSNAAAAMVVPVGLGNKEEEHENHNVVHKRAKMWRENSPTSQLRDPEWFTNRDDGADFGVERPAVFCLKGGGNNDEVTKKANQKLPKSDPTKIVLARTNFLLEFGEEVLPPYHVFHSNSECIAVWCKTGRWSTLQTAVFLHSTAIGNAKSSMVLTMGVAAAHVVLVPALAVGGLAIVTAPWLILKKSKEKWEQATLKLTSLFWDWAEPEVFVEAIEHWSGLCPEIIAADEEQWKK